jgi:hypothetical protein
MKTLSRKKLESRKAQAVRFTRDIRDDPDRADEIEDESLEDYAERRHIKLLNPKLKGARQMATPSRQELLDRIAELEEQNDELQGKLDDVLDVVAPPDEEAEEEEEDEDEGEE